MTSIKGSTSMIKSLDMVFSPGPAETFTKETIRMTPGTGLERCTGQMAAIIKVSGRTVYSMAEVMFWLYG